MLNTKQACLLIELTSGYPMASRTLQEHAKLGHLPSKLIGHSRVYNEEAVIAFAHRRPKPGRKPKKS